MIPLRLKITAPDGTIHDMPRIGLADAYAFQKKYKVKAMALVDDGMDAEWLGFVAWNWLRRNHAHEGTFEAFLDSWDLEIEGDEDAEGKASTTTDPPTG